MLLRYIEIKVGYLYCGRKMNDAISGSFPIDKTSFMFSFRVETLGQFSIGSIYITTGISSYVLLTTVS